MRLLDAMRLAGLEPREIINDGRWHRCPTTLKPRKRNGAYLVRPDGSAVFGDFASGEGWQSWRDESSIVTPLDLAAARAAMAKARAAMAKARADEARRRDQATQAARREWDGFQPLRGGHPYLDRKQLDVRGTAALRRSGDLLVSPVMLDGRLISYQTINADGQKRFRAGCTVRGGSLVLERRGAPLFAFVEGLATGLAVFQCVPEASVVICYDAGNLVAVAGLWKRPGRRIVCADNDWRTGERTGHNTGVEKADEAARILGCGVAVPDGIEGTDWADALIEWGVAGRRKVAMQIKEALR